MVNKCYLAHLNSFVSNGRKGIVRIKIKISNRRGTIMLTTYLQVMDKHLSILAKQHIETRFVKIQAEKSPFLTEKLKIVVLPTLTLIKNAKVDNYVVCQMEGDNLQ